MKRSRLKPKSKKRAAAEREAGPERRFFLVEFRVCAYPNCGKMAACVHEIAFGTAARRKAYGKRETWLPSCVGHNTSGQGFHDPKFTIAMQCAVKKHIDPDYYNLSVICECRGRSPSSITEQEVAFAYEQVYNDGKR